MKTTISIGKVFGRLRVREIYTGHVQVECLQCHRLVEMPKWKLRRDTCYGVKRSCDDCMKPVIEQHILKAVRIANKVRAAAPYTRSCHRMQELPLAGGMRVVERVKPGRYKIQRKDGSCFERCRETVHTLE